jgi:hypothetical protein
MEEFERALRQAEELDASGNPFYQIDASGAFMSNHSAPTFLAEEMTVPSPTQRITQRGDVLLRVYCDKGTVRLRWPGYPYSLYEAQDISLFNGHGFPVTNCPCPIFYSTSDPTARIFTEWEVYAGEQRRSLAAWRDSLDVDRGVRLWNGHRLFACVGLTDPYGSRCTIQQIAPKEKPVPIPF